MEKTTNWQVRLEKKLATQVRKKAKDEKRSLNMTITYILEQYFNKQEKDDSKDNDIQISY